MCGRFALTVSPKLLAKLFGLTEMRKNLPHSYNIGPGQDIAGVLHRGGERVMKRLEWGWEQGESGGSRGTFKPINARGETVGQKRSFREAFEQRRCLIPAEGFYEWRKEGRVKQPYYFYRADGEPLALAGIWQGYVARSGKKGYCTAIITTEANALMQRVHHRMPVIIAREQFETWLSPESPLDEVRRLLAPYPESLMGCHAVGLEVNRVGYDRPECVVPIQTGPETLFDF